MPGGIALILRDKFDLNRVQGTMHGVAPLIMITGPYAQKSGVPRVPPPRLHRGGEDLHPVLYWIKTRISSECSRMEMTTMVLPWKRSRSDTIFINYRRGDAGGFAGRLSDSLAAYFGRDRVFRDVTGIDYGHDFEQAIDQKLSESGAVVVLIGDKWSALTDAEGKRRLDDPADYVSREIAAALQSAVPVVPVLIGDAQMPRLDELPEKLRALARRNAITISDERWDIDVARLSKVLAIDLPGSVAQRKLDVMKSMALLLLFASGTFGTVAFCAAHWGSAPPGVEFNKAGFTPLVSAFPFIAILLAGTLALVASPLMEESKRKFAWASTSLAYLGTLASFTYYGINNVEMPSWSLVFNFGATMIITVGVLALMNLAAFRAK